jgi:hypothetical protein
MNKKCYLCDNAGTEIIERPNGYDGNHVICLACTHYRISRNAVNKLMQGHKVPTSILDKVRNHFEKTAEPYEINTVTLSLL